MISGERPVAAAMGFWVERVPVAAAIALAQLVLALVVSARGWVGFSWGCGEWSSGSLMVSVGGCRVRWVRRVCCRGEPMRDHFAVGVACGLALGFACCLSCCMVRFGAGA